VVLPVGLGIGVDELVADWVDAGLVFGCVELPSAREEEDWDPMSDTAGEVMGGVDEGLEGVGEEGGKEEGGKEEGKEEVMTVHDEPKRVVVSVDTTGIVSVNGTCIVCVPPGMIVVTTVAVDRQPEILKDARHASVVKLDVVGGAVVTLAEKDVVRLSKVMRLVWVVVASATHDVDMVARKKSNWLRIYVSKVKLAGCDPRVVVTALAQNTFPDQTSR